MKAYMSTWKRKDGTPMPEPSPWAYAAAEIIARDSGSRLMADGEAALILMQNEPLGYGEHVALDRRLSIDRQVVWIDGPCPAKPVIDLALAIALEDFLALDLSALEGN